MNKYLFSILLCICMTYTTATYGYDYYPDEPSEIDGAIQPIDEPEASNAWVERWCTEPTTRVIDTFFTGYLKANNYRDTLYSQGYTNASGCGPSYPSTKWYKRFGVRKSNNIGGYDFIVGYSCEGGVSNCHYVSIPLPDTDNDGICDKCDYNPNTANNSSYHQVAYQKDISGNKTYVLIETAGGQFISYGQSIPGETDYIIGNDPWKDISSLETDGLCGCETPLLDNVQTDNLDSSIAQDQILAGNTTNPNTTTTGTDDTGNTLDTEKLTDIVNNTAAIANNQQTISDQLNELKDAVQIAGQQSVIAIGGISPGNSFDGEINVDNSDITQKLQDIADAETTQGDAELSQLNTDLSNIDGSEYTGDIPDGEVLPQEDSISTYYDNFFTNNPVTQYINSSGVNATDALCSINFDYKGNTIPLTMCGFSGALNSWGVVVNGIMALVAFMIIFRRGNS